MKGTIVNLIVVAALSFSAGVPAAEEAGGKAQPAATQPAPAAASAVPAATSGESAPPALVEKPLPPAKKSTSGKRHKAKAPRSKSLDLRHCLELDTNAAIARCAGE